MFLKGRGRLWEEERGRLGGWREGRGLLLDHNPNDDADDGDDDGYDDDDDVVEGGEEGWQPSTRGRLPEEGGGQVGHHHGAPGQDGDGHKNNDESDSASSDDNQGVGGRGEGGELQEERQLESRGRFRFRLTSRPREDNKYLTQNLFARQQLSDNLKVEGGFHFA